VIQRHLALVAAVAAFAFPLAAAAQSAPAAPPAPPAAAPVNPAPPAPAHHHHAHRLMAALQQLNLTDDQKQRIAAEFKAMRSANVNADPATRKANAKQLRSQIRAILTPDQQAQLKANLKAQRAAAPPAPTN
jgi:Spy/CpxP family protein refolding chaperone